MGKERVMKGLLRVTVIIAFVFFAYGVLSLYVSSSKVSAQDQATYVGLEKCKSCHPSQFKDFEKRKFGKAWDVVVMRGKTKDPECLKCHTTGFGKPSGFVSEEQTPNLKFKQCEACHGPGSKHATNPSDKVEKEKMRNFIRENDVCIECHHCMVTHKEGSF